VSRSTSLMVWQLEVPGEQIVTLTQGLFGYGAAEHSDPFTVMGTTLEPEGGPELEPPLHA